MVTVGNSNKSDFLGIDYGTAQHRLRRQLFWSLLVETDRTKCYRCGLSMTVETYSIDHKMPWQGVSRVLYWSHENISYSHNTCNGGAARQGIDAPVGRSWCSAHKEFFPTSSFYRAKYGRPNGLQRVCKTCSKEKSVEQIRRIRDEARAAGRPIPY